VNRAALQALLRARRLAVREAQRDLAAALAVAGEAEGAERAAAAALQRETDLASSLDVGDSAVEAFAAWLPQGHEALQRARNQRARAEVEMERARAALAACRAAAAALEEVMAAAKRKAAEEAARREQATLDEVGQRRKKP
jgi:flagellar export protein FliJ